MIARSLFHRQWFAGQHRFIHRRSPVNHPSIDWDFLPWAHAQMFAHPHRFQGNIFIGAVGANATCALGRKAHQLTDRGTRSPARREFEPFTQKHECDDGGGDFEVHADHAVLIVHFRWKCLRCNRRDEAIRISNEDAEADQGVHVRRAVSNAEPSASVIVNPGPEHDRSRKNQLERAQDPSAQGEYVCTHQVRQHGDAHHGHAQCGANPEFASDSSHVAAIFNFRR